MNDPPPLPRLPQRRHHTPLESDRILRLGETTYRNHRRRFGLLPDDRLRHLYVLGKTGSGKSTLLEALLAQDLEAGRGLAVLDPHGDLVEAILPQVPRHRRDDVLIFAPDDRDWPISYNVFRQGRELHPDPPLLTSQLLSVFRRHWASSWGPRLEHVLRNSILAVAHDPRATLVFLYRFLTDDALRAAVVEHTPDPIVRQFWTKEFPTYSRSLQSEAMAPVLNKLGALVASPVIRNIVGQERSRVDLFDLMGRRGILLAKLPTGKIGEDAAHLLGSLLLTSLQLAAMARPRGGPPFYLVVDEFQNFVTESLATMLAESRKFGLGLTLAHQYLAQLPENLRDAVLGNVGSLLLFRLGAGDADVLAPEFEPVFTALDLQNLERHHVAVKLLARGETLAPFSAITVRRTPTSTLTTAEHSNLIRASRERYARRRVAVEAAIVRSLGRSVDAQDRSGS